MVRHDEGARGYATAVWSGDLRASHEVLELACSVLARMVKVVIRDDRRAQIIHEAIQLA